MQRWLYISNLVLATGCGLGPPPEWTPPDQVGPYAVGATTVRFTDERGKDMFVEVWYPALPTPDAVPEAYGRLSIVRAAYRQAPADLRGAPYPMVAFSHGNGGIRYQSSFLTEHLASHGLVVVSPDHPGSNFLDYDPNNLAQVALNRPADMRISVDHVLGLAAGDGRLAGLIKDGPYAMVGHSFGAWTSLVMGGGVLDFDRARRECAENPLPSCRFFDTDDVLDTSTAVPDARVAVTVPLAPGAPQTFGDLSGVAMPVVIGGRLDADLPYQEELLPIVDALPDTAILATFERSGHWAFTDLCEIIDTLEDCAGEERGFMDPIVVQGHTNTLVTAAVRSVLLESTDDGAFLTADAWADDADVSLSQGR